jgi:hypothetical protein
VFWISIPTFLCKEPLIPLVESKKKKPNTHLPGLVCHFFFFCICLRGFEYSFVISNCLHTPCLLSCLEERRKPMRERLPLVFCACYAGRETTHIPLRTAGTSLVNPFFRFRRRQSWQSRVSPLSQSAEAYSKRLQPSLVELEFGDTPLFTSLRVLNGAATYVRGGGFFLWECVCGICVASYRPAKTCFFPHTLLVYRVIA